MSPDTLPPDSIETHAVPTAMSIVEALRKRESLHVTDIVSHVDSHPVTVERHCHSLQQEGYVRQIGNGVFQLSEEGRRLAIQRQEQ